MHLERLPQMAFSSCPLSERRREQTEVMMHRAEEHEHVFDDAQLCEWLDCVVQRVRVVERARGPAR